jgi:anti-anti-sigma regulatory factor
VVEKCTYEAEAWILLHGQADYTNLSHLEAELTNLKLDGARCVHMHLGDLDFCDTASMRQLLLFARLVREGNREVITFGAGPTFRKVARLLGVAHELGIS